MDGGRSPIRSRRLLQLGGPDFLRILALEYVDAHRQPFHEQPSFVPPDAEADAEESSERDDEAHERHERLARVHVGAGETEPPGAGAVCAEMLTADGAKRSRLSRSALSPDIIPA